MSEQLGFGFDQMLEEQAAAHLPAEMAEAIPVYRQMIDRHHQAMLAADQQAVMAIRKEARRLAVKLNQGDPGILASDDSPAYVLERETAAPAGTVPLWGQTGDFTVLIGQMPVRIELDGMFGTAASVGYWLGFSAHVVDPGKPFISETGYRSFLGVHADIVPGVTPDQFCKAAIESYIKGECKGRLNAIAPVYRHR